MRAAVVDLDSRKAYWSAKFSLDDGTGNAGYK